MNAILFKNARIIDASQNLDKIASVLVKGGIIQEVGEDISPLPGIKEVDISGKWLVPGLIDMHVHLREPGEEYKETIETGALAAASGGFTAVACMPNTRPPNDNASITRFILEKAEKAGKARVYPVAAITMGQKGKELTEFFDLLEAGAVAFSDDGFPLRDAAMMRFALEYAMGLDALIISHSEEPALSMGGAMNEGKVSTLLGLRGIPAAAEDVAVYRDVRLAEITGARLHIAHVSTRGSVEIIRRAKERGVKVTAETAPHYFTLTEEAVIGYNTLAKMNPPLRTEEDRQAVIEGIKDRTIDVIATDHAPHSILEKEIEFERAANGIIGLETAIPLSLELVRKGHITPLDLVGCMSFNPASILRVKGGSFKKGEEADLTIIDPDIEFEFKPDDIKSRSKNSPFLGKTLKGKAVITLLKGLPVHDFLSIF